MRSAGGCQNLRIHMVLSRSTQLQKATAHHLIIITTVSGPNNFSYGSRPLVLHPSPVLKHGIDMATQEPSRSSMFMENIYSPAAREDAYIFTDVGVMGEDDLRDNIQ